MGFFSDEVQQVLHEFEDTKKSLKEARSQLQEKLEELEKTNLQLEISKKELTKKVEDLNKSERAMLNVLEDARESEKKLSKEQDLTKAVISSMGEGLLVVDKEQKIILINQAASILLRWASGDAVGQNVHKVFTLCKNKEKEGEVCSLPIERVIKEPDVVNIGLGDDFYCRDKEGNAFPVMVIMASLMQGFLRGNVSGAVIIFKNITKEKSLDDAKTNFISVASHQLRTPLTSIRWFSEMLLDGDAGDLPEDQKHFVERIYQGADRMINLVNLLLQIARVEAGRVKIEPALIDLKLLTEGVSLTLHEQLNVKKQKINIISKPETLPKILLDEDVVWQIIQNLLSNAIRYSLENGIITVKLIVNKKNNELVFSVEDKGIGIPRVEQNRIFDKFYRADNAVKYAPEGSGLGLNLAKKLVEDWKGRIWFESEEGKGSTFYFTVPLEGVKPREGEVKLRV